MTARHLLWILYHLAQGGAVAALDSPRPSPVPAPPSKAAVSASVSGTTASSTCEARPDSSRRR